MRAALMNQYQVSVEKDDVAASAPNALELSLEVPPRAVLEALCGRFAAVPERVRLELEVQRAAAQPLDHAGSNHSKNTFEKYIVEALDLMGMTHCKPSTSPKLDESIVPHEHLRLMTSTMPCTLHSLQ